MRSPAKLFASGIEMQGKLCEQIGLNETCLPANIHDTKVERGDNHPKVLELSPDVRWLSAGERNLVDRAGCG
jgi:hypothetical protein